MHITQSAHIVATDEKVLRNESGVGKSYLMMRGGYFYGFADSEKHVATPEGIAVMIGDNGTKGPFRTAFEARTSADGRVSNAVLDGVADKAMMNAIKLHGPNSIQAQRYNAVPISNEDMDMFVKAVDAPTTARASVAGVATDRGVDPLASFRALAANGSVAQDDIRQLAIAYTHPDEDQRLPMASWAKKSPEVVRLDREDAVTFAAIRKIERSGLKNRAAEAYEDLGLSIAKKGDPGSAMPFLMSSYTLAREYTREHGRDVRPLRAPRKSLVSEER